MNPIFKKSLSNELKRPLPHWFHSSGEEALKALSAIAIGPKDDDSDYVKMTAKLADGVTRFYAIKEMTERVFGKVKAQQKMFTDDQAKQRSTEELKEEITQQSYFALKQLIQRGNEKAIMATLKAVDIRYRHEDDLDKTNDEFVDGFELAVLNAQTTAN